jgi:ribosomal protein S27E
MVHSDFGWSCPHCGSAIIEPARGEAEAGNEAAEQSGRAAPNTLRG